MSTLNWHSFEMYNGFGGALIAGFLLTAAANWSGREGFSGIFLLITAILWLSERFIVFIPGLPEITYVIILLLFPVVLAVMVIYQLRGNRRNLPIFIPWMLLFIAARGLYLYGEWEHNYTVTVITKDLYKNLFLLLIVIITGRIIPFFTYKRLGFRPAVPAIIETTAILSVITLLIIQLIRVEATEHFYLPVIITAFIAHSLRFYHFKPHKTLQEPMLTILQIGYLWLLLYFAVDIAQTLTETTIILPLHVFTAGTIGTFAAGMMTRVSMGHTGRPIRAGKTVLAVFILITSAAVVRNLPVRDMAGMYSNILLVSALLWMSAFLLLFLFIAPMVFRPRVAGR